MWRGSINWVPLNHQLCQILIGFSLINHTSRGSTIVLETPIQDERPQSDIPGVSWQREVQKWKVEIEVTLGD